MSLHISAIICTHNRHGYLRKAIRSLVEQSLNDELYEILVVDNASVDDTKNIVLNDFAGVRNLRYLYEPVLGLSQARNTGWQEARGEYVAYLDDDAIASPTWLETIREVFRSVEPQPGCVGGRIDPIWEVSRPPWLADNLLPALTILDLSETPRFLNDNQSPYGTNISFPKAALEACDGFPVSLGRKGNKLLSNEEILLIKRIRDMGLKCYYHPGITVMHHVPSNRLQKGWLLRRAYWQGVSDAVKYLQNESQNMRNRMKDVLYNMLMALRPINMFILISPSDNPVRFSRRFAAMHRIGLIWGLLTTR
jgi:glycosyltransferase involved in cell wall biosynthesis